jgi:hypothetical protein
VSARDELLAMTITQARSVPMIADALERVEREARAEDEGVVNWAATVGELVWWTRERFRRCLRDPGQSLAFAAALETLLGVLGENVCALWRGRTRTPLRRAVLDAIAAEHVRLAREGGGA